MREDGWYGQKVRATLPEFMENVELGSVVLDHRVARRRDLPPLSKLVYAVVSHPSFYFPMRQSDIALRVGCSRRAVEWSLARLVQKGLVSIRRGKPDKYYVDPTPEASQEQAAFDFEQMQAQLLSLEAAVEMTEVRARRLLTGRHSYRQKDIALEYLREHGLGGCAEARRYRKHLGEANPAPYVKPTDSRKHGAPEIHHADEAVRAVVEHHKRQGDAVVSQDHVEAPRPLAAPEEALMVSR